MNISFWDTACFQGIPTQGILEDDFPFPKVRYVSFLKGNSGSKPMFFVLCLLFVGGVMLRGNMFNLSFQFLREVMMAKFVILGDK